MKCNTNMLFDYIDGILDEEDIKKLEMHLECCETCRETINTFKLMESASEYSYEVPIDVVQSVRSSTDKDLYSSKKYLFFNRYLSKLYFRKYAAVASIALLLVGGYMLGRNYTLIGDIKDFASTTFTSNKNFQKALENETKQLVNTPYYNKFTKLIEDKQYNMVTNTIVGATIKLPNSLKDGEVKGNIIEILDHGNRVSNYNGLDFSGYLGKKVLLLTCIIEEPNKVRRELICLLSGEKVIGFWESPSIKEDKAQLDSRILLRGLKVDKSNEEIESGMLEVENLIPLEKLPKIYTVEMARSNGDVIYNSQENNNNDNFYKFLKNVENKTNDKVRIAMFIGTDVSIIDLIYDNGNIKAVRDTTRRRDVQEITEHKVLKIDKYSKGINISYIAYLDDGKSLSLISDSISNKK